MATARQTRAARSNIKRAQTAARKKRTIAHLPKSTRRELGKQAARGRARHGQAGRNLEDRNRTQLYEIASVDLGVMAVAIVVLVVAACIAGMIPARRAASINPVQALRVE